MKQTNFIVHGFIVMMFAACSSEEAALQALDDNEIKLTTRVEGMLQTKVGINDYQMNTQLVSGRTLNVYIVDHATGEGVQGTKTDFGGKGYASYTVGANGTLTSTSKPQYPANSTVDIYALHGTDMLDSGFLLNGSNSITGIYADDFMYALEKDKSNTNGPIELTFHHVMSKINVILNAGDTGKTIDGATVSCCICPSTNFINNNIESGLQLQCIRNDVSYYADYSFGTYSEGGVTGIIVPQIREVVSNKPLFTITLADGMKYYYYQANEITFESGKEYTFNLTLVDNYSVKATTSIENWDDSIATKNVDLE